MRIASNIAHEVMPLFVGACDMILCTSVYEGWPNAIKEALACNLPFVSTDVSDLRDIAYQEPSCHICPPEPNILADSICRTLSESNTNNLRRHVLDMDLRKVSQRHIDLYQELVFKN